MAGPWEQYQQAAPAAPSPAPSGAGPWTQYQSAPKTQSVVGTVVHGPWEQYKKASGALTPPAASSPARPATAPPGGAGDTTIAWNQIRPPSAQQPGGTTPQPAPQESTFSKITAPMREQGSSPERYKMIKEKWGSVGADLDSMVGGLAKLPPAMFNTALNAAVEAADKTGVLDALNRVTGNQGYDKERMKQELTEAVGIGSMSPEFARPGPESPMKGMRPQYEDYAKQYAPDELQGPTAQPKPAAQPEPPTVPEAPQTLDLQMRELQEGKRDVMVYKNGEGYSGKPPPGMAITAGPDSKDVYVYNPRKISASDISEAIKNNTIGQKLGLGSVNKEQVETSMRQGGQPIAVTERTPDGVEAKTAAGTDQTAPGQVAEMEAQKSPGHTVQVESPATVLDQRAASRPIAQQFDANNLPTQAKLQTIADDIRKRFGISEPITVVHERYPGGSPQTVKTKTKYNYENGRKVIVATNSEIYVDPSHAPHHQVAMFMHELGHTIQRYAFDKLPTAEQKAVMDAWRKDLETNPPDMEVSEKNREILKNQYGPVVMDALRSDVEEYNPVIRDIFRGESDSAQYTLQFNEWFANQVARFLHTNKEAVSFADKFFKGVADMWRTLYERFTGSKGPTPEIEAFMRGKGKYLSDAEFDRKNAPKPAPKPAAKAVGAASTPTGELLADNRRRMMKADTPSMQAAKRMWQGVKNLWAPEREKARGNIRQALGEATRESETVKAGLEKFRSTINTLSEQDKLDLWDFIQGGKTSLGAKANNILGDPEIMAVVTAMRDVAAHYEAELRTLSSAERMTFLENYAPNDWIGDPAKLKEFNTQWITKEGNKNPLKRRLFPTQAEGIEAGFVPRAVDPIEKWARYAENVSRYIATERAYERGTAEGDMLWRKPGNEPNGWVKIEGSRHSEKFPGQQLYAHPGYAAIYNAFLSHPTGVFASDWFRTAKAASNLVTGFKLALSAYHLTMTAGESMISSMASAVSYAKEGHFGEAIKQFAKSPGRPISGAIKGAKLNRAYRHVEDFDELSPIEKQIVELGASANFRFGGKGKTADEYRFSNMGSYFEAAKKGALKSQLMSDAKDLAHFGRSLPESLRALNTLSRHVGRAMDTLSAPLFEYYIPMVKTGAYFDTMAQWLKTHPEASDAEKLAAARKISDSVDDRFGEMIHDNIFWRQNAKQAAQISMLSYSYNFGTLRQLGGAAVDVAKLPYKLAQAARGKPHGEFWTDKMSYSVIALPLGYAMLNALIQAYYTGEPPKDYKDLMAGRTGGTDAISGEPERFWPPSYAKQLYGLSVHPGQEITNKLNPFVQLLASLAQNKDWQGDPITLPESPEQFQEFQNDPTAVALKNYWNRVLESVTPIQFENPIYKGSKIGRTERFFGIMPAPQGLQAPQRQEGFEQSQRKRAIQTKIRHKEMQKQRENEDAPQ